MKWMNQLGLRRQRVVLSHPTRRWSLPEISKQTREETTGRILKMIKCPWTPTFGRWATPVELIICLYALFHMKYREECTAKLGSWHTVKKGYRFSPVPGRDVNNKTLPGRELLNYSTPGRVWLVTSRPGTGKTIAFFTIQGRWMPTTEIFKQFIWKACALLFSLAARNCTAEQHLKLLPPYPQSC